MVLKADDVTKEIERKISMKEEKLESAVMRGTIRKKYGRELSLDYFIKKWRSAESLNRQSMNSSLLESGDSPYKNSEV